MENTYPESESAAVAEARSAGRACVRCSIILPPSAEPRELEAYLSRLGRQRIRGDYEIAIGRRGNIAGYPRLDTSGRDIRVIQMSVAPEQELSLDTVARMARGKYLLFVRELANFDVVMLEASIKGLEQSGNELGVSPAGEFLLVARSLYRKVGRLEQLLTPSAPSSENGTGRGGPSIEPPRECERFYCLAETCQVPGLGAIYERRFGKRTDGCFVEVGAFDGEFASNTSCLADLGWAGCYIEPVPEYAERCKTRHARNPGVTVSQLAIGPEPASVDIHVAGTLSTISDTARQHFKSLPWAKGCFQQERTIAVQQVTLDDYLAQHEIRPGFELLVVDVEGYEWEVFRNFDIDRWRPQMVIAEIPDQHDDFVQFQDDYQRIMQYFADHNYEAIYKDIVNTVYVARTPCGTPVCLDEAPTSVPSGGTSMFEPRLSDAAESSDILEKLRQKGLWQDGRPLRLHLGCGRRSLGGYINVDYPPSEHNVIDVKADIHADIRQLSFPASTVDEIRLHHVFEHFNRVTALVLLIRWHQWLKIGGQLLLETPDLMGSAKALVSEAPSSIKMGAVRHLVGDQSAGWGYHLDLWFEERFDRTLTAFGFDVLRKASNHWAREPYLCNIQVLAVKRRDVPIEKQVAAAEELLRESTVSPDERPTWEVWCRQLRAALDRHVDAAPQQARMPPISSVAQADRILGPRSSSLPLDEIHNFNRRTRNRWVQAKAATVPAGSRVLDVGAGTCPYRDFFSHCDYRTQDFKGYAQIEKDGTSGYGQIDYVSDITNIPVPDESFDIVLCTEVLEHVPEPVRALEELARILRRGGRLLLTAPLGSGLHQLPYHYYGGLSKQWYVHFLPTFSLKLAEIAPNGGLFRLLAQECARVVWTMSQHERFHGDNIDFVRHLFGEWLPRYLFALEDECFIDQFTVGYHVEAIKLEDADVGRQDSSFHAP